MNFFMSLISAILAFVHHISYIGILAGMAIESSFFPFPSEALLIPAGVLISQGNMNFALVWIVAFIGSMVGSIFNYFFALYLGRKTIDKMVDKYGKFLFVTHEQLEKTDLFFKDHGEITIFLGRMLPIIRELISLPAGFAEMDFFRFALYTAIGSGVWDTLLIVIGLFFGSNAQPVMKIATGILLLFIFLILVIYAINNKKHKGTGKKRSSLREFFGG